MSFGPSAHAAIKAFSLTHDSMQEELLSKRVLIFVNGQVYWKCGYSYISEVYNLKGRPIQDRANSVGTLAYAIMKDETAAYEEYSTLILYYMSRRLTYDTDVLRAAQGMLRKFSKLSGVQCLQGLPAPLDRSLLWAASARPYSRAFGRRRGFPSYSWIGWKSGPRAEDALETCENFVRDCDAEERTAEAKVQGIRTWIRWHCKLADGVYSVDDAGNLKKSPLPNPEDTQRNARPTFQQIPVAVSDVDFGAVPAAPFPLLLFWTICINLDMTVGHGIEEQDAYYLSKTVADKDGNECGVLRKDEKMHGPGVGKFAIVAAVDDGLWALHLAWADGVAERRGIVKLNPTVLDNCLPPGPRWKAVVLG